MARERRTNSSEHPFRLRTVHAGMVLPKWVDAVVLRSRDRVFIYTNTLAPLEERKALAARERAYVLAHPNGPGVPFTVLEAPQSPAVQKEVVSSVGAVLVQPEQHQRAQNDV
ncbi:MAG TPA: hypothetical protein GX510_08815 [Firmicutes bacterium]|nr:hypothetical protein [Candidatus Fermentithermobacillaceae bacterium]